jgi:hypothetical protein
MNNLALATNSVGKESSGLLINGFMDDARNSLSPYGSISLSVATAGLLIERPPIGFSDKNIEFVIKEGYAKEARFMGGQRTKAEYLYSKVWNVWLNTLVERDDFCFLDANDKRTDNLKIEYSKVSTGHDFWSLPHSEETTSFEQT